MIVSMCLVHGLRLSWPLPEGCVCIVIFYVCTSSLKQLASCTVDFRKEGTEFTQPTIKVQGMDYVQ